MNKKLILLTISCCLFTTIFLTQKEIDPAVDFYNVTFLRNSPAVEKVLKERGFFEADLITADNLKINTIMLDQSNTKDVQATIVSCPGFVPGRKEGMTTLYAMLEDQPYNFIFIDSRGHGKSEGELLTLNGIKQYGKHQYLDIVATIEFITEYNQKYNLNPDIILHGLCAGAFHTIKAVDYIRKNNPQSYACIKGIIFDSGWPSVVDIAETVVSAEAAERCSQYSIPFLQPAAQYLIIQIYRLLFKEEHKTQESIVNAITEIDQPILFIHAQNDVFTPVHHVHPLIARAKQPISWFVQDSSHVANHLKHKEKYTERMQQFIQTVL